MGVLMSKTNKETTGGWEVNYKIERELIKEKQLMEDTVKLLLLGAGESGKTTILKQIRILHDNGFSPVEVEHQRSVVYSNTVSSMGTLIKAMQKLCIPFELETSENDSLMVLDLLAERQEAEPPSIKLTRALKNLWSDAGVKEAVRRSDEYYLNDSAIYFLSSLNRILSPDFKPTQDDILHTRVKTTGVNEVRLNVRHKIFRVVDVGGQRSERKKWIHCFQDISALIFVTSLSEYDQVLLEDGSTNRMHESMRLFQFICNSEWFSKTPIILFFNKTDLFAIKIRRVSIALAFPDYKGSNDYGESCDFIKFKFRMLTSDEVRGKSFYSHETCATDTGQVAFVLDSTFDVLLSKNMGSMGVY